jgi:hypothetical protein
MTLAIAHKRDGLAVVDRVDECRPPFSPMHVLVNDFAPVLERYRVTRVVGDNVSRGFVEATLRTLGITFEVSTMDKSALYLNLLSLINSGAVELLDDPTLRLQILSLQRYPTSGGKDRVDHPRGKPYHDDVCNVVAGAVGLVSNAVGKKMIPAVFSGSSDVDANPSMHAGLAALARATILRLEAQDRSRQAIEEEYENAPMISAPIWHVHQR